MVQQPQNETSSQVNEPEVNEPEVNVSEKSNPDHSKALPEQNKLIKHQTNESVDSTSEKRKNLLRIKLQ